MRRAHCTPRPAAAHAPAAALLARRLPLRGYKRSVPAAARARALALLGAWACSLQALAPGRRWTVGLARVRSNRMPAVLRALWPQVEASGLRVRRRLLDGGFYCAGVVRWLQRRGVPFVLPVPRKGTAGGTRALYGRP